MPLVGYMRAFSCIKTNSADLHPQPTSAQELEFAHDTGSKLQPAKVQCSKSKWTLFVVSIQQVQAQLEVGGGGGQQGHTIGGMRGGLSTDNLGCGQNQHGDVDTW